MARVAFPWTDIKVGRGAPPPSIGQRGGGAPRPYIKVRSLRHARHASPPPASAVGVAVVASASAVVFVSPPPAMLLPPPTKLYRFPLRPLMTNAITLTTY